MTKKNTQKIKSKGTVPKNKNKFEYEPVNTSTQQEFSPQSSPDFLIENLRASSEYELQDLSNHLSEYPSDLQENLFQDYEVENLNDPDNNSNLALTQTPLKSRKSKMGIMYWVCSLLIIFSLVLGILDTTSANLEGFPSRFTDINFQEFVDGINPFGINSSPANKDDQFFLRIIHTNDLHSKIDSFGKSTLGESCYLSDSKNSSDCFGGLAKIKTVIDELKLGKGIPKSTFNSIVLDAGDQIQGSYYYSYYKGLATGHVLRNFGYDAMTLGNHEFDDGPSKLSTQLKSLNIPVVSANMVINKTAEPVLADIVKPYIVIRKYNLGIIGLTTNNTAWTSSSGPNIVFVDMVKSVNDCIEKLHTSGINRIILLTHIGYDFDKKLAESINPGVSVIVGGHSHSFLYSGKDKSVIGQNKIMGDYPTIVKNNNSANKTSAPWSTFIVQAKCWGEYVGHLDVVFDKNGRVIDNLVKGSPIRITSKIQDNPSIKSIVTKYQSQLHEYINTAVGSAALDIPLIGNMTVVGNGENSNLFLKSESQMGNLISMALMSAAKIVGHKSVVNFALISSGMIKTGLLKGNILRKNIMKAVPYNNPIAYAIINGTTLVNALNGALSGTRNNSVVRGFVYFDGIRVNYTQTKTPKNLFSLFKKSDNQASVNIVDKVYVRKNQFTIDGLLNNFSSLDRYKLGSQIDIDDWEPLIRSC
ncbi:5'-nucleotidase [Smittium mucronatum]|uniref:5'-nucleotidase n=1 Tax=Smittium mucronatum TaxID=133383 RepID=A0A1R0GYL3_9FUNG|nr:5'-nucleotidase [Smittium mucronatum]